MATLHIDSDVAGAHVFANEGAQLVLLDRAPIGEAALVKLAPAQCLPIALDCCDAAQVAAAVARLA